MELKSKLKFKQREEDSARNQKLKRNLSIHNPSDYKTINKESIDSSSGKNYYFRDRKTRKRQLKDIDINLTVGRW